MEPQGSAELLDQRALPAPIIWNGSLGVRKPLRAELGLSGGLSVAYTTKRKLALENDEPLTETSQGRPNPAQVRMIAKGHDMNDSESEIVATRKLSSRYVHET